MSLRFRRSIKLIPGLKLNLTKRGVGLTLGGRGAHVSVNSQGNVTRSFGLPGTGVSWQSRKRLRHSDPVAEHSCPDCGQSIEASDEFCPHCGVFLGSAAGVPSNA